jgi:hypothetical protein
MRKFKSFKLFNPRTTGRLTLNVDLLNGLDAVYHLNGGSVNAHR